MGHSIGDLVVYAVACLGIAHFFGFPMMAVLIFMFVAISLGKQRKPGAEQFAPVYLAQTALGLRYGVASVQGRRQYMEDMHQAVGFDASQQAASAVGLTHFFAVFDGHGGKRAASWAHTHLVPAVLKELAGWSSGRSPDAPAPDQSTLDNAVISAFHSTDRDFLETALQQGIPDGSTAVTAMIQEPAPGTRKERRLLVANLGDSRCVMVRNDGSAQALSTDHKPNRPEERARIQARHSPDWTGPDWTGLGWAGLGWAGLDWTGLDWTGLDWTGLDCTRLDSDFCCQVAWKALTCRASGATWLTSCPRAWTTTTATRASRPEARLARAASFSIGMAGRFLVQMASQWS